MEMNGTIKIAFVTASFWMLLTSMLLASMLLASMLLASVAMAQQVDDQTKLEQLTDKLRAATVASAAKQDAPTKKQNAAAKKKKKVAAMKKKVAVKQEIVAPQQTGEVTQVVAVETKVESQIGNVRAEAQTLAKAAAQAHAAAQIPIVDLQIYKALPFNRTMRLPDTYNLPPTKDGVHDPANEGINALHSPQEAFADLPRRNTGNRVDWVAALNDKKIAPRWERSDAQAEGMVMDMDIVRVPRGSMPNVVFPHKQHTEWLACTNCHPEIFVPQKGANLISMRQILSGEKCGVCHGKVAFPPSECRLCHSQSKDLPQDVADAP